MSINYFCRNTPCIVVVMLHGVLSPPFRDTDLIWRRKGGEFGVVFLLLSFFDLTLTLYVEINIGSKCF